MDISRGRPNQQRERLAKPTPDPESGMLVPQGWGRLVCGPRGFV